MNNDGLSINQLKEYKASVSTNNGASTQVGTQNNAPNSILTPQIKKDDDAYTKLIQSNEFRALSDEDKLKKLKEMMPDTQDEVLKSLINSVKSTIISKDKTTQGSASTEKAQEAVEIFTSQDPQKPVESKEISKEEQALNDYASEAAALSAPESAPQTSSTEAPYGWAWLKTEEIKFSHRGKTPISGFDMLYTTVEGDIEDPKEIQSVYIILDKENKAPNNPNACPPLVRELIYHKLADGREFCGVKIEENTVDKQGKTTGYMESEIKIDDDTANLLMDLLLNQSGWNNKTGIKYSATTSPRLIPPKFY